MIYFALTLSIVLDLILMALIYKLGHMNGIIYEQNRMMSLLKDAAKRVDDKKK